VIAIKEQDEEETQVGRLNMALTRDFRETVRERAQREPAFRQALLREGLQLINDGDFATGRAILRNYINATIGFSKLARKTKISSPSLQRMFGPNGNPSAQNLVGIIAALKKAEGVGVEIQMYTL
jgi:DNA-binding phage protein